ncbi:MAG: hypothetical protein B7C24_11145 [Bacteroidetes bacterium 4572_77]|nr:MAG: hypothetical protein B7C24_11145 [Bacteroidetes bacterium 4572_77]
MKKIFTFFIALTAFAFSISSQIAYAQNQVFNPSFENWTAGEPDEWTINGGAITITENTTSVHEGSSSCQVLFTSQDNQDLRSNTFAVTAGETYDASVWVYDNDDAGRVRLTVLFEGGDNYYGDDYSEDMDSWQQLSHNGVVPAGATEATFQIRFYDVSATWDGECEVIVDDVLFDFNTSILPEPSNYPSSFSLSENRLEANLTWTDATGAQIPTGYLILGSTSDNISAPADGTPVDNDMDISDGSLAISVAQGEEALYLSMQNGLLLNQTYYFKIYPYTNGGADINYKTDATPPAANTSTADLTLILNDYFPADFGSWNAVSVIGDQLWENGDYNGYSYVSMSGYSGGPTDNEDWFISPAINLSSYSGVVLSFMSAYNYDGPDLELFYSTDYTGTGDPNTASWNSLSPTWPSSDGFTWAFSDEVSISSNSTNYYLAYKYNSNTVDGSAKWEVSNILLTATGGSANPATKLDISSINSGNPVYEGQDFTLTVQAQDTDGAAANVSADVNVTISVGTGSGTLGGTITGTIANGTNTITLNGTTYSPHENGVVLNVNDDASNLTAGNSDAFDVLEVIIPELVISEIMYNAMGGEDTLEYLELYNNGSSTINLNGFEITEGVEHVFGDVNIGAGNYLLLAKNANAMEVAFGLSAIQWDGGGLKNTGEDIEIIDASANVVAFVDYDTSDPWPVTETGKSIRFCSPGSDNNDPALWSISVEYLATIEGQDIYGTPLADCGAVALDADFEADNTAISMGESVNFADLSVGDPTGWSWTFSGGSPATSEEENPQNITYASAGTFDVSLTITKGGDNDTETKTGYIVVSDPSVPPVADFSADVTTIFVGQSVQFTDLSQNLPTDWQWTFDGGTPASSVAQNPSITYNTAGTYDVTLFVENSAGNDVMVKENYIEVLPAAVGDLVITEIMYNPPETDNDTLEYIEIYNNSDDALNLFGFAFIEGIDFIFPDMSLASHEYVLIAKDAAAISNTFGITALQWTDGSLSNGGELLKLVNPTGITIDSVPYQDGGSWPAGADGDGPSITICDPNTENSVGENWHASVHFLTDNANGDAIYGSPLQDPAPVADFTADETYIGVGDAVNFENLTSCNASEYDWMFEGGTPSTTGAPNPTVTYNQAGDFDVTLTAYNATGEHTLILEDYIHVGVGIAENNWSNISISPNPSNGYFKVNNPMAKNMQVLVYNILGERIQEFKDINGDFDLNIATQENGMYFVQILIDNQQKIIRVIKQ